MENNELYDITHSEQDDAFDSSLMSEDSDYLEHHGIKGQKWGVRRFQNKDGSLTDAGLKRYRDSASNAASAVGQAIAKGGKKVAEKISEKHAQRKEAKRIEKLMSKPVRKLTDEERAERTERRMKEKELLSLEKNVSDLKSGAMSKGKKFLEDMVTKVAIPSVLDAGQKQLTSFLNKKLGDAMGLGDKDSTIVKDLLSGDKQLTDLTDGQINKVGKAAEGWGNVLKNFYGKNSDQNDDSSDSGTLFQDLMSGKVKTSDLNDGKINKGKKLVDAADAINKYSSKQSNSSTASADSSDVNSSKTSKPISEMSDSELKAYKNRIDTEESVKKVLDSRKEQMDNGRKFTYEYDDWEY